MEQLTVKKVDASNTPVEAIPALLDSLNVAFNPIDKVNWTEYPYAPNVNFRIAYTDSAILLNYRVTEQTVRAVAGHDNGEVWKDACVEFFSIPNQDGVYYNFECNCAGTLLVGVGPNKENRELAPKEVLERVQRWSSLGREPFEERVGETSWELVLIIPFTAYFKHRITSMQGKTIRANFYKCGDDQQTMHFLSWNPIDLPSPNFHCPPFFGTLVFE